MYDDYVDLPRSAVAEALRRRQQQIPGLAGTGINPSSGMVNSLPNRFWDDQHYGIDMEDAQPAKPGSLDPDMHPDYFRPTEAPPVGYSDPDENVVMGGGGADTLMGAGEEFDLNQISMEDINGAIADLEPPAEAPPAEAPPADVAAPAEEPEVQFKPADQVNYPGTAGKNVGTMNLVNEGRISKQTGDENLAGIELTLEQAGRFALGMQYLNDYPKFRKFAEEGGASGPIDYVTGLIGRGDQGELMRRLDSGQEGLVRIMTGAAMPEQEARRYAYRYSPSWSDDAETVVRKLDGLARDIHIGMEAASVGRPFFEIMKERYPQYNFDPDIPDVQLGPGGDAVDGMKDPDQMTIDEILAELAG